MKKTPSRPYLIRALHDWILDNGEIPYLLVDAEADFVCVPKEFVEDGRIILDISPEAVRELIISNETIEFRGRFSEAIHHISLPINSIQAIYDGDGVGMFFEKSEFEEETEAARSHPKLPRHPADSEVNQTVKKEKKPHPHLKIVK